MRVFVLFSSAPTVTCDNVLFSEGGVAGVRGFKACRVECAHVRSALYTLRKEETSGRNLMRMDLMYRPRLASSFPVYFVLFYSFLFRSRITDSMARRFFSLLPGKGPLGIAARVDVRSPE